MKTRSINNPSKSSKSNNKNSNGLMKKSKISECAKNQNCLKMYDYMIL